MRFGGHETFPIREGWLNKGLRLLIEDPDKLGSERYADWLGVGRNMGKSIKHWLVATGLAVSTSASKSTKKSLLKETELGKLIFKYDPYFLESGTWWVLHVNLVNNPTYAYSWSWFFNSFNLTRFERAVCLEGLRQHLQMQKAKMPSLKTIQRDLNCLLATYAKRIPIPEEDPEEASTCPLVELDLMTYFSSSGFYMLNTGPKNVPGNILGYTIAKSIDEVARGNGFIDVSIRAATVSPGGPGRSFVLTNESLYELVTKIESEDETSDIQIAGLAGERLIRIRRNSPLVWLEQYYYFDKINNENAKS